MNADREIAVIVFALALFTAILTFAPHSQPVQQSTGFTKAQFVHYLANESNPSDFVNPYSIYELCNPTAINFTIANAQHFNMSYFEGRGNGRLLSTHLYWANVTSRFVSVNRPTFAQISSSINGSGQNVTIFRQDANWDNYTVQDTQWIPFTPINFKVPALSCVKLKVEGTRAPSLGASSIDNVLSFNGYSFPEYAWWNTSAVHKIQIKINVTTPLNITELVVPVPIPLAYANCSGVQYTNAAENAQVNNENGSNASSFCNGVEYINITAFNMSSPAPYDPNFTVYRYYNFTPMNFNRTNPQLVWNYSTVNVWNFDVNSPMTSGGVLDSLANNSGTGTAVVVYNTTPNATIGRSIGFGDPTTGGFGSATNSYVDVSGNAASGNAVSIVAYVRTFGAGGTSTIYSRKNSGGPNLHDLILFTGKAYGLHEGCASDTVGTTNIEDGKWHLIITTRNATHHWIYVDGAREGAGSQQLCSSATTRGSLTAYIGYQFQNGIRQFNGTIDYLWLYNRTINDAEALALMNTSKTFYYGVEQSQLPFSYDFGVNLTNPGNNSATNDSITAVLSYNYSGNLSKVLNCSVYLNDTVGVGLKFNTSNSTPIVGGINNITVTLGGPFGKQLLWNVNCSNATAAGTPYAFSTVNQTIRTSNNTWAGGVSRGISNSNVTCNFTSQRNQLVQPFGQTSSLGYFNFTNKGTWIGNLSVFVLNSTNSSYQIFLNTTQNATLANLTRNGNATVLHDWAVGEASSTMAWLWVNCSSELRSFVPRLRFTPVAS